MNSRVPYLRRGLIAPKVGHFRGSENPALQAQVSPGKPKGNNGLLLAKIIFLYFLPKKRMSSPQTTQLPAPQQHAHAC
jgi:hypothetical protein